VVRGGKGGFAVESSKEGFAGKWFERVRRKEDNGVYSLP